MNPRYLIINADDFGIGPATSRGILDLAHAGHLSSSVLLANSPYAAEAVDLWKKEGRPMALGWHPALTLDKPILSPGEVSSLVNEQGFFFSLNDFLLRMAMGKIDAAHLRAELTAQYRRCCELLGSVPMIVNAHHHIQIFPPVGAALRDLLSQQQTPYFRIVREPWPRLVTQPGARMKRLFLNYFGRRESRRQRRTGFLGGDWLIGVINNSGARHQNLFVDLVKRATGNVIELTCHPGMRDETLIGRDCTADDGMLERRPMELAMLADNALRLAWQQAGFELITPERLGSIYRERNGRHAEMHSPIGSTV